MTYRPPPPETYAEAVAELEGLMARLPEMGDGTNVYDRTLTPVETYATALFGPTVRVAFTFDDDGNIRAAHLAYYSGGDEVLLPIPQWWQQPLCNALRADWAELERHGR